MENHEIDATVGGRPSVYSEELAERICELIANTNMGLRGICRQLALCYSTVYKWTMPTSKTYRAAFRRMYLDAKEMQAAALEEEILELAGDSSLDYILTKGGLYAPNPTNVARCRLQIATKQWLLGRLAAKAKEQPEEEERERQWMVFGGYFVDPSDRSTVEAWQAAEAWKLEKEKEQQKAAEEAAAANAEAAGAEQAVPETKEAVPYFSGVYPGDFKGVIELPEDALKYDEDREVVEEQLQALRDRYAGVPQPDNSQPGKDRDKAA